MKKEEFHIEYTMNRVSRHCLWNLLTTVNGLSSWFAEKVTISPNNKYSFSWKKEEQMASVIEMNPEQNIKFQWDNDKDSNSYFEFTIYQTELTGITTLEITDFALPSEKEDYIDLWDSQIATLKRKLGI